MLSTDFLPAWPGFRLDRAVVDGDTATFVLTATAPSASCPDCGHQSRRIHSRYIRTLADLPGHGRAARLQVHARRFFCPEPGCPR